MHCQGTAAALHATQSASETRERRKAPDQPTGLRFRIHQTTPAQVPGRSPDLPPGIQPGPAHEQRVRIGMGQQLVPGTGHIGKVLLESRTTLRCSDINAPAFSAVPPGELAMERDRMVDIKGRREGFQCLPALTGGKPSIAPFWCRSVQNPRQTPFLTGHRGNAPETP